MFAGQVADARVGAGSLIAGDAVGARRGRVIAAGGLLLPRRPKVQVILQQLPQYLPAPLVQEFGRVNPKPRARPRPPAYRALIAMHPSGSLTEVPLVPSASVPAAIVVLLDCRWPLRLPLARHLDMWANGDGAHSLPLNRLAAGLGLRHGLSPRCYHGAVLLCGTAPGPRPAGLNIDQVLAVLVQIADVAEGL